MLKIVLFANRKIVFLDKKDPAIQIRSGFLAFADVHKDVSVLETSCFFPKIFNAYRLLFPAGISLPGVVMLLFFFYPICGYSTARFFA